MSGMNPYINGMFGLIPITLIVINISITKRILTRAVRASLRIVMILGILVPIGFLYFKQADINKEFPPRRYTGYSDQHK
jgi:glucan phosphoethanolaminetransferase (alkaline phosphatase superfamily)